MHAAQALQWGLAARSQPPVLRLLSGESGEHQEISRLAHVSEITQLLLLPDGGAGGGACPLVLRLVSSVTGPPCVHQGHALIQLNAAPLRLVAALMATAA